MATKGVAEVTVLDQTDATAVRCWYQISASATLPLAPTTTDASATPSGWSRSEPSITSDEDAAKYVYACWQTVWGDGTCDWGDVSMSASFEAAKRAWNMAHSTQQNLDNLRVGGTNLIVHNETSLGRLDTNGAPYTSSNGGYHLYTKKIPVIGGMPYVLSWFYKVTEYATSYLYVSWFTSEDAHIDRSTLVNIYNREPDSYKLTAPDTAAYAVVSMSLYLCVRCAVKFEQGHVPTDLSLSEEDAACPPNMLRGTNQPGILLGYNDASGTWENGLWRVGSGTETSGSAELIPIDDFEDSRQRYGFRVWSTTTGNKDVAQMYVPYKANTYYRVSGFVRLTKNSNQTSATLQFRLYASSALKTYTKAVDSEEWTKFTYVFSLTEAQAALSILTMLGVKGKGSLEYCALYLKRGYVHSRMSMGETYLPWQPAAEDYATYGETSSRLSQAEQALEDAESTVVATHRIYYRTATAQPKPTSPTTWVPEAQSNVYNAWTTKKPPLAASVAETVDTYPYLYTCEQRELLGGGIECTDVQLDESATVIDGSMIINGSVAAQQIAAHSITTNELNTNQLTIGVSNISDFNATVSEAIDNAINLTPFFSHGPIIVDKYWSSTKDYYVVLEDGWGRYEQTTSSSTVNEDIGILPQTAFEQGVEYTVLLEWRNFTGNGEIRFAPTVSGASNTNRQISISENSFAVSDISETSGSDRRFVTCSFDADSADRLLVWRAYTFENSSLSIEIRVSIYKGRYYGGYRPYVDQSLIAGYSNLDDKIDDIGFDIRSYCPTSFDKTDGTRWYNLSYMGSTFTKLDDGWYHYNYNNTAGESAISQYIAPTNWSLIQPGEMYTILFEIKNFSGATIADAKGLGYLQAMAGAQFYGNSAEETVGLIHDPGSTYFWSDDISEDGLLTFRLFKRADTDYIGSSSAYDGMCFRYRLYATAGYVTSYDFRISIYPGKYYGDYTPYLVNSTYNKLASVDTDILGVVSDLNSEILARKATYGTCSTAASTAAKIVICDGFDSDSHPRITVYFTTANTAAAPTLTIQDSDGATLLAATPIWNHDAVASASNPVLWGANATLNFIYDGTNFVLDEKPPAYTAYCSTSASTRAKSATIAGALVVHGTTVQVLFSTANTYVSNSVQFNFSGTGAANIYRNRAVTSTTNTLTWPANTVLTLVRYGQYWYLADNGTRTMAENAEKSATNFITEVSNDGIWITPSDAKPVSGAAAATTSGWHIADALELFRQGVNMFKVWVDLAAKMWLRLGDEDGGHILMGPDEITINNGELEAYKITASAETDEESNTRYESWLELSGAYIHSTEYADSTGNTISNQNALVADNHMGEAAVSAESWVDEHDFYWGRRGGGESEVVATGYSAVNLSGNVLVLDDQHSSGTRTYPFDMTDVIATLRSGAGTILFSGSYSTTYNSAITGLPDLTNYMRLLVEYEDSTGRRGSVWVSAEDGGTLIGTIFGCTTTGGNNSSGLVIRSKSYKIALTSIDTDRDSYNRLTYGKATISPSNGVTYANSQEIGIVRVFGFR